MYRYKDFYGQEHTMSLEEAHSIPECGYATAKERDAATALGMLPEPKLMEPIEFREYRTAPKEKPKGDGLCKQYHWTRDELQRLKEFREYGETLAKGGYLAHGTYMDRHNSKL